MTTELVYYQAAKTALAQVVKVDEAKNIRDKALAMQAYAKQAKDNEFFNYATEIRMRAERRMGELMADLPKATGTRSQFKGKDASGAFTINAPEKVVQSYKEQGINPRLADRARKFAAMPPDEFEGRIRDSAEAGIKTQSRNERQEDKRQRRSEREEELAEKTNAISNQIGHQLYNVILADPAWRFEVYSVNGMMKTADNHYPTSSVEEFMALDVAGAAADNCVLYLWVTVPMLPEGLRLMAAWGFEYKSHLVWVKDRWGTGYWLRNKHELLLIGTKGNPPAPLQGTQPASAIEAPVGAHSEKPEIFYEIIEGMFPTVPKLEMFARAERAGWDYWGNEME